MDATIDLKVVFLGPVSVGKTCLICRYCNGTFSDDSKSTVGASFLSHAKSFDSYSLNIMIWDTAGSERFNSVTPMVLRGVDIIVLVFDLSEYATLEALDGHIKTIAQTIDLGDVPVLLIGNKSDLKGQILVDDVKAWMDSHKIKHFVRVSAKTGDGVTQMLDGVLRDFIEDCVVAKQQSGLGVVIEPSPQPQRGCC